MQVPRFSKVGTLVDEQLEIQVPLYNFDELIQVKQLLLLAPLHVKQVKLQAKHY